MSRVGWARAGAAIALAACGWIAVHGLSSARATAGLLPATTLPWDADALPAEAPDGRVLALRPTDDRARVRDLVGRTDDDDGAAFRRAAAGVGRWARGNPDGLLLGATVALDRHRRRREPEDRRAGEDLLRTFLRRTPGMHGRAGAVLIEALGPDADARALAEGLPPTLAAWVAHAFAASDPAVAWELLLPALADPSPFDDRHGLLALDLARARPDAGTTAVLEALSVRPDASASTRRDVRAALDARAKDGPR